MISCVSAKAILGVDMGSLYMKVALVQRGAPLEIVTNLHSKRKTEQMILFDQGTRFYGADASSLLARKPTKTPSGMTVMLGRDEEHPAIKVLTERHFPLTPLYNETRKGLYVMVDGKESYTPEELTAMVLSHAEEMTKAYGAEKGHVLGSIQDCVLTVPSFATQAERQAYLDAAELAGYNVLSLIDENTASALNFGMDKMYEEPQTILFYNLGASSLQVSVIKFHTYGIPESKYSKKTKTVGSIEVLGKAWDTTLGGHAFDNRLVDFMTDHFNREWRKARGHEKDIRDVPRAMTKIRLQANKVKHILSANQEIPIRMDSLYDDMSLAMHITRAQFEELCEDLMERAVAPVHAAVKSANLTMDDITAIELIGGGMRVPKVQSGLSEALGDKELGMHLNSDESMALGAAFFGANISTAFRVRHVGLTDITPFPVAISLEDLPEEKKKGLFGGGGKKDEDEEQWSKQATIFKAGGKIGVKKTIAFTHDSDVHCALDYADEESLPQGSASELQRYKIKGVSEFAKDMEAKGLGKPKISLQFELSQSGITQLVKAEAVVEETYTVEEEVEVEEEEDKTDDEDEKSAASAESEEAEDEAKEEENDGSAEATESEEKTEEASNETKTDEETTEEKPKEEKKKKTKIVEKEKKRTHKKTLQVEKYFVGHLQPMSSDLMDESKAKMAYLAQKDKERVMLEAAKNKVESYVYLVKNKLIDDEENIAKVTTEEQREELRKLAMDGEDWLYDEGYTADLAATEAKYAELSEPAEKVWFRVKEMTLRPEAISALQSKLEKVETILKKWETDKPHITEEEKGDVMEKVEAVKKWIEEKEAEQAEKQAYEDPAFTSEEVPLQTKSIERLMGKLNKKPKPKPPKKEAENKTETEGNETAEAEAGAESEGAAEDSEAAEDTETEEKTEENAEEEESVAEEDAEL